MPRRCIFFNFSKGPPCHIRCYCNIYADEYAAIIKCTYHIMKYTGRNCVFIYRWGPLSPTLLNLAHNPWLIIIVLFLKIILINTVVIQNMKLPNVYNLYNYYTNAFTRTYIVFDAFNSLQFSKYYI